MPSAPGYLPTNVVSLKFVFEYVRLSKSSEFLTSGDVRTTLSVSPAKALVTRVFAVNVNVTVPLAVASLLNCTAEVLETLTKVSSGMPVPITRSPTDTPRAVPLELTLFEPDVTATETLFVKPVVTDARVTYKALPYVRKFAAV